MSLENPNAPVKGAVKIQILLHPHVMVAKNAIAVKEINKNPHLSTIL
jgi:hypothetical protein